MSVIGVDVGGTFTDLVLFDPDTGTFATAKVPSTPQDPAEAILTGIRQCLTEHPQPERGVSTFLHGTTVTTNALIQMAGARTALLVTRDLKAIAQVQSQMKVGARHAMDRQRMPALVDDLDIFEITGRLDQHGHELIGLDEDEIRRVGRVIAERGIESVAISLLFSFANPDHEHRVCEIIRKEAPQCLISCSADIIARIREWPRMSTAILNAYLEPVLVRYLSHLVAGLSAAGVRTRKTYLMESNGGVMPFSAVTAGGKAVHTLLSGPAATVQAAQRLAESADAGDLVTMDVGGTSCDIAFVRQRSAMEVTSGQVCGYELHVPMLDIMTIGAGGGTIARVDAGGSLRLGPQSAGALPGPATYARGGTRATVTDADVVLGYLNPANFLGGAIVLDVERAREAVRADVAEPLNIGLDDAALAMVRINDAHMADAIRVGASQRDFPLSDASVVASGGAGPVHAAFVAEELGIREVLVPEFPGVFSAMGLHCTDVRQDYVQSSIIRLDRVGPDLIQHGLAGLADKALDDYERQGFKPEQVDLLYEVDARYAGQGFEIRVPVADHQRPDLCAAIEQLFHEMHMAVYGHSAEREAVEVVSFRVRAVVPMPQYRPGPITARATGASAAPSGRRPVRFVDAGYDAAVYDRTELAAGDVVAGPAIVEQADTTTVIPPGWVATVDRVGTLVLRR